MIKRSFLQTIVDNPAPFKDEVTQASEAAALAGRIHPRKLADQAECSETERGIQNSSRSMTRYFATHSTSFDNEQGFASGHKDVELSHRGRQEAAELPHKLQGITFDLVVCSSLKRSIDTATLAFGDRYPVLVDKRLDELNYGDLNGARVEIVHPLRLQHVAIPFPRGECYNQRLGMMREVLEDVKQRYPGKRLLTIGHRATPWSLEVLVGGKTFEDVIRQPFRLQPYWEYRA